MSTSPSDPLRIASYNIRKAVGTDRRRDPARILRVIAETGAEVVLLQEADLRLPPRRPVLDSAAIRAATGLEPVGLDHGRISLGWHGNAVLAAPGIEVTGVRLHDLPGLEPRGCISVEMMRNGKAFRVVGVHLGLLRSSRRLQLTAVLGFLQDGDAMPTLIAGDFNERSLAVGLGRLARQFRILSGGPSYHSRWPVFALDRMAVTAEFRPLRMKVHRSAEADRASDHLPLVGEFLLAPQGG
ncbi:endonuclease/exonuclease/phosphatase family protein [Rhodobacter sp.]